MTFHGCLAFAATYSLGKLDVNSNLNNFVSAMAVTFSAGVFSRFTGRQAVGNAAAGLYVVLCRVPTWCYRFMRVKLLLGSMMLTLRLAVM